MYKIANFGSHLRGWITGIALVQVSGFHLVQLLVPLHMRSAHINLNQIESSPCDQIDESLRVHEKNEQKRELPVESEY